MNENNVTVRPLKMGEKLSYGFGDLASVLYWQTFMLYFTYFYTDVFIIPVSVAATMFLVSRLWDGVNDPLMGMLADRTNTKWGKFRPYLLWLSIPFAISGVLVFTIPDFGETGKIIWAYATFLLIMMLYTAINIPYTALLGVISPNSNERTSVSSVKFMFAFAAGIIVSATLLPMVQFLGGGDDAQGWQYSFMIYGVAAVLFFFITFKGTRERINPPKSQNSSIKRDLKDLFANKPWIILLAATLTFILFIGIRSSVTVHYFKYVIGTQELDFPFLGKDSYDFNAITSMFNTVNQISSLLGVLGITWISKKLGKKKAFISLFVISIISTALFYFLSAEHLVLMFILQIVYSLCSGPLSVLLWAMYADTADYSEWKTGRRSTGLIFSASTMSQKFGWAIGAFIALTLMSQVGFVANTDQSDGAVYGLLLLFSIVPAIIGIISLAIAFFYPLDDVTVEKMVGELEVRRKNRED